MKRLAVLLFTLFFVPAISLAQTCYTGHFSLDVPDQWELIIFDDSIVYTTTSGDNLFVYESDFSSKGPYSESDIITLYTEYANENTVTIEKHNTDTVCYIYKEASKNGQFLYYKNGYVLMLSFTPASISAEEEYCINNVKSIAKTTSYFASTSSAYCSGKWRTYTFSSAYASLDVPSNSYVLHKEMKKDNPALSFYGLSKEDACNYLDSIDADLFAGFGGDKEMIVTFADHKEENSINSLSYEDLISLGEVYRENIEKNGDTFLYSKPLMHDRLKFCRVSFIRNEGGMSIPTMLYLTDWYKRPVVFAFASYSKGFTTEDELLFDRIVCTLTDY